MQKKKLRVLCLHGWRTNSNIMNSQTKDLQNAFGETAEFVFLNGPTPARGPPDRSIRKHYPDEKDLFEWANVYTLPLEERNEMHDDWVHAYGGIDRSMSYFEEKLREWGEFDIVIGFSQGAAFSACMTAYYLKKGIKPWKCVIAVCGPQVRCLQLRELFETPDGARIQLKIPSIHIIGKKDPIYSESHGLAEQFAGEKEGILHAVFVHGQGHKFPSGAQNVSMYAETVRLALNACQYELPPKSRL